MKQIRVLVASAQPLFRDCLALALTGTGQCQVVATAADVPAIRAALPAHRPDVLLADATLLADLPALEATGRQQPTAVLLLADRIPAPFLETIRKAGWSCLSRSAVPDVATLVQALQGAARGLVVLDHRTVRPAGAEAITPREQQVLHLVAEGYSNAAIARQLYLSEKSVENHITSLYHKLGVWQEGQSYHPRVRAARAFLEGAP